MAVSQFDSNGASKREWQKPEVTALKVDLRSVAGPASGTSNDSKKTNNDGRPS